MPNRRRNRGFRRPRRAIMTVPRRRTFQTTLTGIGLKLASSGVNIFSFSPQALCPDLQVPNQFRQFKLMSVTARFYPNQQLAEGTSQLSVQLLIADLATNTQVPATPIVPLSLVNSTRLRARSPGPRWVSSNAGAGENIFAISVLTLNTTSTIRVDLSSVFVLSTDQLSPPPAFMLNLEPDSVQPLKEEIEMLTIV